MKKNNFSGIFPVNKEQEKLFAELKNLSSGNISCLSVTGKAGTGKSLLIGAYILDQLSKKTFKKVVLSKPMEIVGSSKYFGTVPGGTDEKMAPFLLSFKFLFKKLIGDEDGEKTFDLFKNKGIIEFIPIELMRGISFPSNTIVYLDECQNIDTHCINTLGTRVGEGCQLILSGDLNQIDISSTKFESGLKVLVNNDKYKKSKLTGHVHLVEVERGPIAKLFTEIFEAE